MKWIAARLQDGRYVLLRSTGFPGQYTEMGFESHSYREIEAMRDARNAEEGED